MNNYFRKKYPKIIKWLKELLCNHDYQLSIRKDYPTIIHSDYDEIRQSFTNKVLGNKKYIEVRCSKCQKKIIKEKHIGYDINYEWLRDCKEYNVKRRKAIKNLDVKSAKKREESLAQLKDIETIIRWKIKDLEPKTKYIRDIPLEIEYYDGQPCEHRGCMSHQSHPCEGCGRISAKGNIYKSPYKIEREMK